MRLLAPTTFAFLALSACGGPSRPTQTEAPALTVAVQPSGLRVGQRLSFNLNLSGMAETWNLALFVEDPEGHIDQLLPNHVENGGGTLPGGTPQVFPDARTAFFLLAGTPTGTYTVLAYAAPKPLDLSSISAYAFPQDAFATVNENRQGQGSVDGSLLAVLRLTNHGVYARTTFTVTP